MTIFLTCAVALMGGTVALLLLGHRVRVASPPAGILLGLLWAFGSGEVAARLWDLPTGYVIAGQVFVAVCIIAMVVFRPLWNPIGQVFFGAYLGSAVAYLCAAAVITVTGGLSVPTMIASSILLALETIALTLASTFAFESCDVLCRSRWSRDIQPPDPTYLPMVSLQIAAYNEPPDMLIETIKSAEAIDYPNFEILVIDNNTKDPDVWQPVAEYCEGRDKVRFVHVDPWPGFKSGALNLALTEYTAPDAEIVGVIDADYVIDPSYLKSVVGYFADPTVGFVQTPQDYREYEGDSYLTACYDAYKYFFVTSMPSRNERNSIIFAGTMGLLRRSALEELGGWDEWCITEDAETSLRMLKNGHSGVFVPEAYGHGIMPLTFSSLKSQRFRWCFGGMQILRRHWRELMPWDRDPKNKLSIGQRFDYLISGVQWMNDLINLGFSLILLSLAVVLTTQGSVTVRPLFGLALLLPGVLMVSGLLRAMWALRTRTGISLGRSLRAFANWLSLSFTVAIACVQGLTRAEGVFMRTPKESEQHRLLSALKAAWVESVIAAVLWSAALVLALTRSANVFVIILFAWQGSIYASSVLMSWLNQHTVLSAQLERRKRSELRRERLASVKPYAIGGGAVAIPAAIALAAIMLVGGSQPAPTKDPFALPKAEPSESTPAEDLITDDEAPAATSSSSSTDASTDSSDVTTTTIGSVTSTTAPATTTTTEAPTTTTTEPPTTTTTVP